ncbi:MAG: FAD-binding oxidoreductase [Rhodobacteraceae bacterium]|nr:FAD-binding oxidoreductase [Paracoccaceae bacterium]
MQRPYEAAAYDTSHPVGSYWESTVPGPISPEPASGEIRTEIAVIGGGFTGLNAALQLAEEHSAQVHVIEAGSFGWGASGRNGGFCCLGGAKLSLAGQVRQFGLDETRRFVAFQKQAIARVADNLERYGIEAECHSDGELQLAHSPAAYKRMQAEAEADRQSFGLTYQAYPKAALAGIGADSPGFHGGIREAEGFALNPLKYVQGLAHAAETRGVTLHANSPATAITQTGSGFVITTPQARICTDRLIVATNGYSADDVPGAMRGRFLPVVSAVLVTRPISAREQADQGWSSDLMSYDSRHLLHYFRLMPDGRFLFGQRGAVRWTASATEWARRTNRRDFEAMFPAWANVETAHFWAGLLCLTPRLHPFLGPLPGLPGAFAAYGYHGNGVAMASAVGRALGDMAAGRTPDLPAILKADPGRFPLPILRRNYLRAAYVKYRLEDALF